MIAVAVLVVQVTDDSRDGKADARLATGLETAQELYDKALRSSPAASTRSRATRRSARRCAPRTSSFLRRSPARSRRTGRSRGRLLRRRRRGVGRGRPRRRARAQPPAGATTGGERVGEIEVATLTPDGYVDEVSRLTGVEALRRQRRRGGRLDDRRSAAPSCPRAPAAITVDLPDGSVRAAALALDGAPPGTRLVLTHRRRARASSPGRRWSALILLAFFALACGLHLPPAADAAAAGRDDARGGAADRRRRLQPARSRPRATTRWPASPASSTR